MGKKTEKPVDISLDEWSKFSLENALRDLESAEVSREVLEKIAREFDDDFIEDIIKEDLLKDGEEKEILKRWIKDE